MIAEWALYRFWVRGWDRVSVGAACVSEAVGFQTSPIEDGWDGLQACQWPEVMMKMVEVKAGE
jgi:hypothetical protein